MNTLLNLRQEQILIELKENEVLTILQLAKQLDVSIMTIHRDLNRLAAAGKVQKLRGVARLATSDLADIPSNRCEQCGMRVPQRTAVSIHLTDGQKLSACCPHCGILLLAQHETAVSTLAREFLYGRMVNIHQSYFSINSDVQLCCLPNTICFSSEADARKFQLGFSGEVMDFKEAMTFHNQQHHQ